jgi:hypothetical protein
MNFEDLKIFENFQDSSFYKYFGEKKYTGKLKIQSLIVFSIFSIFSISNSLVDLKFSQICLNSNYSHFFTTENIPDDLKSWPNYSVFEFLIIFSKRNSQKIYYEI